MHTQLARTVVALFIGFSFAASGQPVTVSKILELATGDQGEQPDVVAKILLRRFEHTGLRQRLEQIFSDYMRWKELRARNFQPLDPVSLGSGMEMTYNTAPRLRAAAIALVQLKLEESGWPEVVQLALSHQDFISDAAVCRIVKGLENPFTVPSDIPGLRTPQKAELLRLILDNQGIIESAHTFEGMGVRLTTLPYFKKIVSRMGSAEEMETILRNLISFNRIALSDSKKASAELLVYYVEKRSGVSGLVNLLESARNPTEPVADRVLLRIRAILAQSLWAPSAISELTWLQRSRLIRWILYSMEYGDSTAQVGRVILKLGTPQELHAVFSSIHASREQQAVMEFVTSKSVAHWAVRCLDYLGLN